MMMKFQALAYKEDPLPYPSITSWRMLPHSFFCLTVAQ